MLTVPARVQRRVGDNAILRTRAGEFSWPDPAGELRPGALAVVSLKEGGRVRVQAQGATVVVTGQRISLVLPKSRGAELPARGELQVQEVGRPVVFTRGYVPTVDQDLTEREERSGQSALAPPRSKAGDAFAERAALIAAGESQ